MDYYGAPDRSQVRRIRRIIDHPQYNSGTMAYDFSILELESPFTLDDCIGTVCLPGDNEVLYGGETCFITGWGTLNSGGSQPNTLQEAEVVTKTNAACNEDYSGQITNDMLCANGEGKNGGVTDACQGDSGGPLVCLSRGRWVLHGATSWG